MRTFHRCGRCLYRNSETNQCGRLKITVSAEQDACPSYIDQTYLTTCTFCGRQLPIRNAVIFSDGEEVHHACNDCANLSGYCHTCAAASSCLFNTDPSPIPMLVQKQIRQGNMVSVTTVKNTERVKVTCAVGCKCFDSEFSVCNKEQQEKTCQNYTMNWRKNL